MQKLYAYWVLTASTLRIFHICNALTRKRFPDLGAIWDIYNDMLSSLTLEQLTQVDPDRLRSASFSEKSMAANLKLLYAFHYELAKVPERVTEPMIGHIRYQWWRDVVAEIYEGETVRSHEIATPLSALFKATEMPRFWVDRLIDGRVRDLDPTPFATLDDAMDYCTQTSGLLIQMAVHLSCSHEVRENLDMEAVSIAGQAWGLTGLARSWRFYHKSMLTPLEFEALCTLALKRYETAKDMLGTLPADCIPAISYVALVPKYIKRMSHCRHNPELSMPRYAPFLKTLRLLNVSMRGRI